MGIDTATESRQYPSRLFYMDLLLKEAKRTADSGKSLDEILDQVRVIWTVKNREAVLTQLELHLPEKYSRQFADHLQQPVTEALSDLVDASEHLEGRARHSADCAVSRINKYLRPENQLVVIAPWMKSTRLFRAKSVTRTLSGIDDLSPYANLLVRMYRDHQIDETLKLIARTPAAAAQIVPLELNYLFEGYYEVFKLPEGRDHLEFQYRRRKYFAMIAARVLIVGNQSIPAELMRSMPEIFSWAIEDIDDPANEPMLTWLVVENSDNPEVLWSAIRTARRRQMYAALSRAMDAARLLLTKHEGVLLIPHDVNVSPK